MQDDDNYHWLFRNAPVMATLIGADGRYLDINEALLSRLGYEHSAMLNQSPASFVTADTAQRIDNELLPTLRRTGRLENKRVEFVTAEGEVVPCITSSVLERDPGGTSVRTLAMYTEMAESANVDWKYRQLYRSTPAMLHIVDANGCLVTATDHWLQKMGYSREEVVGRSIAEFFSDADRERISTGRLKEIISGGSFQNEDRQMVTRDGDLIDLVQSAISERDASGQVNRMLVASKDVTERNRAERALRTSLAENAKLREELERERDYLREEVDVRMNYGRIVGRSAALRHMLAQVEAVADTPANVLVLGESGVGKELVARAIHARSSRAAAPLVKVNCASIPRELFESEFFGHVRGAFTGAHKDRVGRFQLADGGTIFLDEVGEIPAELQGKLLRVLQESEYERVGDDMTRKVDVRVIAATNKDLKKLVDAGEFREDLFYRLSVFPIDVPPLRKRREDLYQLAMHFLKRTCEDFGREPYKLTRAQVEKIEAYDWPGNVRELKNVIERAVILSNGGTLRLDLSLPEGGSPAEVVPFTKFAGESVSFMTEVELKALQKKNLLAVLQHAGWRVSGKNGAAELIGIRPTTLADRIKSFGIKKPSG